MNDPTNPVGGEAMPERLDEAPAEVDAAAWPQGEAAGFGEPSEDLAEIEFDGRRWQVPAPLKAGFMMQADYTRKTQDLAEQRRALDAERAAVELDPGGLQELAALHAMDQGLAEFGQVDWETWRQCDPAAAEAAWASYEQLWGAREQAGWETEQRRVLSELEGERDRADRLEQAELELIRDIDGWSPQMREQLFAFALDRGFTAEELSAVDDPREVKVLHLAMLGAEAVNARHTHAAGARFHGQTRPPTQVRGAAYAGSAPSDRQGTDAWMKARQAQLRKKAKG